MTKSKVAHPHLTKILREMFLDNYGGLYFDCVLPEADWKWPNNVDRLEAQSKLLTATEKVIMAAGEHSEQKAIVKSKKVQNLNTFLNEVFDGKLFLNFLHNDQDN